LIEEARYKDVKQVMGLQANCSGTRAPRSDLAGGLKHTDYDVLRDCAILLSVYLRKHLDRRFSDLQKTTEVRELHVLALPGQGSGRKQRL